MTKQTAAMRLAVLLACLPVPGVAEEQFITVYSTRMNSDADYAIYGRFTEQTGIVVHRLEGDSQELIERIQSNPRASRPDVLIVSDAATMDQAASLALLDPLNSPAIEQAVPVDFRSPQWFGFAWRARVMIYNKIDGAPGRLTSYFDLSDPQLRGKVCTTSARFGRSLNHLATLIGIHGPERATAWARGVATNLARLPKGQDIDLIRAVADADPCEVSLVDTDVLAAMLRSKSPRDAEIARKIGIAWPDQEGSGTYRAVSAAALVRTSSKKELAVKFLEYLVTPEAQRHLATAGTEWPVTSVDMPPPALDVSQIRFASPLIANAERKAAAIRISDQVGYR